MRQASDLLSEMRMVMKTTMVLSRMVMVVMVMVMVMMTMLVRMMIMHLFSFTVSRAGDLSCVMSPASVH